MMDVAPPGEMRDKPINVAANQSSPQSQSGTLSRDETQPTVSSRQRRHDIHRQLRTHPHLSRLHPHPLLPRTKPRLKGPVSFLNPTRAYYDLRPARPQKRSAISYVWSSRNNRKGRHAVEIDPAAFKPASPYEIPPVTSSAKETTRNLWKMFTYHPIWDVSYDVAIVFTWGSVVWVINAFFAYLPLVRPETEFKNEILTGGGVTAFIGATIFVFGSVLLMIEAVNENRTGCFGWALKQVEHVDEERAEEAVHLIAEPGTCTHHHRNKRNLVGKGSGTKVEIQGDPHSSSPQTWVWWPSRALLRSHYYHEIGFIASLTQMIAATIFEISGFTALPGIINHMSRPVEIVLFWTPQVVGGTGFIISGALFMIETQTKWYIPAPRTLGWWIGLWNTIGGIGFTLCPAFGYSESSWAQYQASLSTFWGSWAFLIGSVIQWYESLQKYPVRVRK